MIMKMDLKTSKKMPLMLPRYAVDAVQDPVKDAVDAARYADHKHDDK